MKKISTFQQTSVISAGAGIALLVLNFTFLSKLDQVYAIVNLAAAILILGVPLMYKYTVFKRVRKIEEMFPKYLDDVSENIAAGMTLPQAIRSISDIDYGALNPYIKEIAAK